MMSVEAARPRKLRSSLSTSSSSVTSPCASLPWVTLRTTNSWRLAWTPVTRSTALKMASTGPSPIAASWTISPSGRRIATVAVGQHAGAGRRVQADELPVRGHVLQVLLDQDDQVLVVDFLLLVGQRLEVVEEGLELLVGQV